MAYLLINEGGAQQLQRAKILQEKALGYMHEMVEPLLAKPAGELDFLEQANISNFVSVQQRLGEVLIALDDVESRAVLERAVDLARRYSPDGIATAEMCYRLARAWAYTGSEHLAGVAALSGLSTTEFLMHQPVNIAEENLGQARHWLLEGIAACPEEDNDLMSRLLMEAGKLSRALGLKRLMHGGDGRPMLESADELLTLAVNHAGPDGAQTRAILFHELGNVNKELGRFDEAVAHYQRSVQEEERRGDLVGAAQSRYEASTVLYMAGRLEDALIYGRSAVESFAHAGKASQMDMMRAQRHVGVVEKALADVVAGEPPPTLEQIQRQSYTFSVVDPVADAENATDGDDPTP